MVRKVMEAFARRDAATVTELAGPRVRVPVDARILAGAATGGRGRAVLRRHRRAAGRLAHRGRDVRRGADGRVLVMYRVAGRGRRSGVPLDREMAAVDTDAAARLLFAQTFLDLSEALREARLKTARSLEAESTWCAGRRAPAGDPGCSIRTSCGSTTSAWGRRRRASIAAARHRAVRADHRAMGATARPGRLHRILEDGSFLLTGRLRAKHATSDDGGRRSVRAAVGDAKGLLRQGTG